MKKLVISAKSKPKVVNLTQEELTEVESRFSGHIAAKRDSIKREAARRILAIAPEWKQRNLIAQATVLAKKGEANWTQAEADAWASGESLWSSIASIRLKSDALEDLSDEDLAALDLTADEAWQT